MTLPVNTLVELIARRFTDSGDDPVMLVKRQGQYRTIGCDRLAADVWRMAAAISSCGVQPGDRVIQVSENRYEWVVSDLAIQLVQAVHVPVHAPLTGAQIRWQIEHSEARLVLLSGQEQAVKLAEHPEAGSRDRFYWSFDPCTTRLGGRPIGSLAAEIEAAGTAEGKSLQQSALRAASPDSLATILYTSGTTGEPKGVMLSQGNLVTNALATCQAFPMDRDDLRLCFLPLSHIFSRTCDLYTWIATRCRLALAENRETVMNDCASIKPTVLNGVPYFFDRVYRAIQPTEPVDRARRLRESLGGAIRYCASGGAALPEHVCTFFHDHGVPLLEGYGLTETSPVITVSTPDAWKPGSVGQAIANVQVRIAADGEILTRGPHVMPGYWKNPEATAEILKDGWLHTGDVGQLDDESFLYITGRKKELIVTSGGKNIAPVYLESLLVQDPLIDQAMVVGERLKFLAALIVPDFEALQQEAERRDITAGCRDELLSDPGIIELLGSRIRHQLADVSRYEQVGQFTLLDRCFTIEQGELTPKLSLRRKVIEANFSGMIQAMYAE